MDFHMLNICDCVDRTYQAAPPLPNPKSSKSIWISVIWLFVYKRFTVGKRLGVLPLWGLIDPKHEQGYPAG